MTLIVTLLISTANAGWFARFCERNIVAMDPYPFAERSSQDLLELYEMNPLRDLAKELDFRARAGMLTKEQTEQFYAAQYPVSRRTEP